MIGGCVADMGYRLHFRQFESLALLTREHGVNLLIADNHFFLRVPFECAIEPRTKSRQVARGKHLRMRKDVRNRKTAVAYAVDEIVFMSLDRSTIVELDVIVLCDDVFVPLFFDRLPLDPLSVDMDAAFGALDVYAELVGRFATDIQDDTAGKRTRNVKLHTCGVSFVVDRWIAVFHWERMHGRDDRGELCWTLSRTVQIQCP